MLEDARTKGASAVSQVDGIQVASLADIPDLVVLEEEVWAEGQRASAEMWLSRIERFPEGTLIARRSGTAVAAASMLQLSYDPDHPIATWAEATGDGCIRNHDPSGNAIYGVNISAISTANGLASDLIEEAKRLVISRGLDFGVLGARMMRYHRVSELITADEYVDLARQGEGQMVGTRKISPDPELVYYQDRHGLEIVRVLPNYFTDPDSLNYGVMMVWRNPDKI